MNEVFGRSFSGLVLSSLGVAGVVLLVISLVSSASTRGRRSEPPQAPTVEFIDACVDGCVDRGMTAVIEPAGAAWGCLCDPNPCGDLP